jgi:hypothetical protein
MLVISGQTLYDQLTHEMFERASIDDRGSQLVLSLWNLLPPH